MKSQFQKKYGGEYVRAAELNEGGCVNPKVVEKLDCQPPSGYIITVGGWCVECVLLRHATIRYSVSVISSRRFG